MKFTFCTMRQRTVTDITAFTLPEFIDQLTVHRPTEIFNPEFSKIVPCWHITEYLENNRVKYFAHGWANQKPSEVSMEDLYKDWMIQGLVGCYFNG